MKRNKLSFLVFALLWVCFLSKLSKAESLYCKKILADGLTNSNFHICSNLGFSGNFLSSCAYNLGSDYIPMTVKLPEHWDTILEKLQLLLSNSQLYVGLEMAAWRPNELQWSDGTIETETELPFTHIPFAPVSDNSTRYSLRVYAASDTLMAEWAPTPSTLLYKQYFACVSPDSYLPLQNPGKFAGCVEFQSSSYSYEYADLTIRYCVEICRGLKYDFAGLRMKNCSCHRATDPGVLSTECNTPCPGNSLQLCGGTNSQMVYQVAFYGLIDASSCVDLWRRGMSFKRVGTLAPLTPHKIVTSTKELLCAYEGVATTSKGASTALCNPSWISYKNECYFFNTNSLMSSDEADFFCRRQSGDLTTLHQDEINLFEIMMTSFPSIVSKAGNWLIGFYFVAKKWTYRNGEPVRKDALILNGTAGPCLSLTAVNPSSEGGGFIQVSSVPCTTRIGYSICKYNPYFKGYYDGKPPTIGDVSQRTPNMTFTQCLQFCAMELVDTPGLDQAIVVVTNSKCGCSRPLKNNPFIEPSLCKAEVVCSGHPGQKCGCSKPSGGSVYEVKNSKLWASRFGLRSCKEASDNYIIGTAIYPISLSNDTELVNKNCTSGKLFSNQIFTRISFR